jgi:peptide/nickel transport system substrate-binding protein
MEKRMNKITLLTALLVMGGAALTANPSRQEEKSLEELTATGPSGVREILARTTRKPWRNEPFVAGRVGGTWNSAMTEDPKSFNHLIAEQDSATAGIVGMTNEYLIDYNVVTRQWEPLCAFPEVIVNEAAGTLDVVYTLRENLYWTYYNSSRREPVTSDDVVFWYNEISGDPEMGSSAYYQQFVVMSDGSEAHVDIEKLDNRRFVFHYPRIVTDPYLSTNMDFGPRHVYEPAKRAGGADGVRAVFSVNVDPQTIPSMGKYYITEYTVGQRIVFKRNPNYWEKDSNGVAGVYPEEEIVRIIPEKNTQYLLFKEGAIETWSVRPTDIDELVYKQNPSYTVFNADGSLSAQFWTFNQNPKNKDTPQYEWFTQTAFRQAMSCLLNRDRLISQVYRGLAEPKLSIFPEPNPFYDPGIVLQYTYNTTKALQLLSSIGMRRDTAGVMRDAKGRAVEFDLSIQSEASDVLDTASVIMDELSKVGIRVNIRVLDFQKLVEQLFSTFDWQTLIIALSGSGIFPSQGSNTWPSDGNLHLWHPNQETPATDWEARIDYLYHEAAYTYDAAKAKPLWDEFQKILLDQCPLVYLVRRQGLFAIQNRWDFSNFYYDNMNSVETRHIFLKR